jgi:enoyl-CoA hydratase
MGFETIQYDVDGHVATITLDRPEVANAQNTALIDELDAALDLADADDEVRVVVLAANGKHFSAGHDLKALVGDVEPDQWRQMRETPEGKLHHEKVMYFDRCLRLRDFRKPTIAAVQGKCIAAGVMLACMCDLIVAAEDASFQNPVLRMTGAAVEILVEPWEMPARKAKEFLLAAETFSAAEAERLGMVNRVVPSDELLPPPVSWPSASPWSRPPRPRWSSAPSTRPSSCRASETPGTTTSWRTTGCTTPPPRSAPWRPARRRAP